MPATTKQAELLQRLKLPVPPDFIAASRLLDYALKGNNSRGATAKQRRAIIRQYWQRWVGHFVQIVQPGHSWQGKFGTVQYLRARTAQEVADLKASFRVCRPLPFVAVVSLDPSGHLLPVNLTGLKRTSIIQKYLF